MPYVKAPNIVRLTLATNKAYWVDWRENMLYRDMKNATKQAVKINIGQDGMEAETDPTAMTDALLLGHIAAWNLDDEDGQVLSISPESLEKLDSRDIEFLLNRANADNERQEKRRKNS